MKTVFLNELKAPLSCPAVATIGFFDGVHMGHRHLIRQVQAAAHAAGCQSMVITFDRHPREVLTASQTPFLLTSLEEKLRLLASTEVDRVVILPFSRELSTLSAHDFMQQMLADRLGVRKLVIGYDNRFGHNRTEGFDDYVAYGREMDIEVIRAEEMRVDGTPVSSSAIRSLLADGAVDKATRLLGRPYELTGKVVHGFEEGRKIGFPTANLQLQEPLLLVPKSGVYAVTVGEGQTGMLNIGTRPTFDGHQQTIEVHIFNFTGNLYDRTLRVSLLRRIRDERPFSSPEALRQQLEHDREEIQNYPFAQPAGMLS